METDSETSGSTSVGRTEMLHEEHGDSEGGPRAAQERGHGRGQGGKGPRSRAF